MVCRIASCADTGLQILRLFSTTISLGYKTGASICFIFIKLRCDNTFKGNALIGRDAVLLFELVFPSARTPYHIQY